MTSRALTGPHATGGKKKRKETTREPQRRTLTPRKKSRLTPLLPAEVWLVPVPVSTSVTSAESIAANSLLLWHPRRFPDSHSAAAPDQEAEIGPSVRPTPPPGAPEMTRLSGDQATPRWRCPIKRHLRSPKAGSTEHREKRSPNAITAARVVRESGPSLKKKGKWKSLSFRKHPEISDPSKEDAPSGGGNAKTEEYREGPPFKRLKKVFPDGVGES